MQGLFKLIIRFSTFIFKMAILYTSFVSKLYASSYVIFSMSKDLPMGFEGEVIRKNYYVNIGQSQGVQENSTLDVYRQIAIPNPYNNKKLVNYKVKVGQLKVLHASSDGSIAIEKTLHFNQNEHPLVDLQHFMIGDQVTVNVEND